MYIQISCNTLLLLLIIFVPAITLVLWLLILANRLKQRKRKESENTETLHASYAQTITGLKAGLENLSKEKEQKEQLIAIVIHDLKSPLRFLSMHMENLQENLKDMTPEELKNYTLLLKNTVNDVYLFTQEVLLWLNNSKDDSNILKKNIDIKELINNTARLYQEICQGKNNRLEIAAAEPVFAETAAELLNVIIRNLLDNANKFTTNGLITVTTGTKDQLAYITVTDTGMGMDQEMCNELTNYDLNNWHVNASRKHLGYKIINDLLLKLGGSVNIVSELRKGTSVTVLIPVA